jgi:chemotaxis response regulator CheB
MPGAAIELGAATQVLPADKIAGALIARVGGLLSFAGEIES